jgi:16S rRNA (uracil1498-N3)-methyltransferase
MTTAFFAPPEAFRGDRVLFSAEEAHHAVRVLRASVGEVVVVVDGAGGWHRVRLDQIDRQQVAGTVLERRSDVGEPAYHLTIGLALLKNPGRFETFLEKAVELGVHTVMPLLTARTEKTRFRPERYDHLLVAAMKQCGRSRTLCLTEPQPLKSVLQAASDLSLICHEQADPAQALPAVLSRHPDARQLRVLVGPEGGFSDEEVRQAVAAGYLSVSLGPRRLRAETAALAAAAAVMLAKG